MTRYLSLSEYFWLAEQVTGIDAAILAKASRIELPGVAPLQVTFGSKPPLHPGHPLIQ